MSWKPPPRPPLRGRSGDQGIDGLGTYRLVLLTFPVFFQCKRYTKSVGPGAVRDFRDRPGPVPTTREPRRTVETAAHSSDLGRTVTPRCDYRASRVENPDSHQNDHSRESFGLAVFG